MIESFDTAKGILAGLLQIPEYQSFIKIDFYNKNELN